ncbi:hypothetical protein [Kitasatospora sp. NPDC058218]|uniref:hypothetical protein n=1 Tax=Kitasatospora sp. NPDC058218 TaxID=3346385 RepID=UPI0036DB6AA1
MVGNRTKAWLRNGLTSAAAMLFGVSAPAGAAGGEPFLGALNTVTTVASTVPANGDVNPYGTAVARHSVGDPHRGNVLISNFNNARNQQGTGSTLVRISPDGHVSQFAQIDPAHLPGPCPGGIGLTTALSIQPDGWIVVGSLPTADGTSATAQAGCLLVLDSHGTVRVSYFTSGVEGILWIAYDPGAKAVVTLNGQSASGALPSAAGEFQQMVDSVRTGARA